MRGLGLAGGFMLMRVQVAFLGYPSAPSPCGRGLGRGLFRLPENEVFEGSRVSSKPKRFSNRRGFALSPSLSLGRGGGLPIELRVAAGNGGSAGCLCVSAAPKSRLLWQLRFNPVATCVLASQKLGFLRKPRFQVARMFFLYGCRLLSGSAAIRSFCKPGKVLKSSLYPVFIVQAAALAAPKTAPSPARRTRWIRGFRTGTQSRGRRCRTAAPKPRPAVPRRAGRRAVCRPEAG